MGQSEKRCACGEDRMVDDVLGIFRSVIPVVYLRTKYTNTCRRAVKNTTIIVIYKVLVYIQMS